MKNTFSETRWETAKEIFLSLAGVRGGDIQMLVGTFDRNPVLHYLALAGR